MPVLPDDAVRAALAGLPGWELGDGVIVKEYRFATFRDAVTFINLVADAAERADHHPELTNVYNRVRVAFSTHSEGGITARDLDAAREVEALAAT